MSPQLSFGCDIFSELFVCLFLIILFVRNIDKLFCKIIAPQLGFVLLFPYDYCGVMCFVEKNHRTKKVIVITLCIIYMTYLLILTLITQKQLSCLIFPYSQEGSHCVQLIFLRYQFFFTSLQMRYVYKLFWNFSTVKFILSYVLI